MKKRMGFISCFIVGLLIISCSKEKDKFVSTSLSVYDRAFFGDSTSVFINNKLQNGYRVSIIQNKQLILIHFERGDSISQYCAIHELPIECRIYEDSIGVFNVDFSIPVVKIDTLGVSKYSLDITLGGSKYAPAMFFMDVNFDNEEEFIVAHEGYNRTYYACFDLVNGNRFGSCPGLLESNNKPPYDNIVSGINVQPSYTVFNRQKKEIYIYETMGCCSHYETWAKYFERDDLGHEAEVKVIKKEHHDYYSGTERIEIYKLIDDSLKLVDIIQKTD